jgi:YidC/Oxa1 family membrane protein insertase
LPEIRNPNLQTQGSGGGGGGDMRSTMLFMFVMIAVLLGYQYFFKPPTPATPAGQTQSQTQPQTQSQPAQPSAPSPAQMSAAPAPAQAAAAPLTSVVVPTVAAALETDTVVENEFYRIDFTNRGAQVRHWILKKYKDTAGKPLDLVQPQTSARFGYPLSLFTYEPALTSQLNQGLYQVSVANGQPSATGLVLAPNALTFHYAANGLDVVKTIRFDTSYVITVESEVKRNGEPVRALVQWPAGLGDMEEFLPSSTTRSPVFTPSYFAWSLNGKQDSMSAGPSGFLLWSKPGVSNNDTINEPYSYAAVTDLYFAAAFLPDDPDRTTLVTLHNTIDLPSDLSDPKSQKRPAHVLGLAVGDTSGFTRLRLFAGPKAMDVISSIHSTGSDGKPTGQSLEPLIQFGFWTFIAKPLYIALRFTYEHVVANWGWDIIIITIIFNLVLLPTRIMMMRSSLKMMRIQPKVDAIKRKYAHLKVNDPKRTEMNTEMMQLYKDEGVNMYGGCLPILLQMPLFFAYYRVLANVIELRQAHWFWLTDLSAADPLHILPILIIASMFLVQFLTPSPGMDPSQRRMMAIMMPVVFGFSMWHFASGLALYWGTGNIINLAIQLSINQSSMGKEMHAIAARRAAKKPGGGPKTIQGKR